jgi:hypothetical protein
MQLNFPSYKIIKVTSAELDKYPRFEPVKLKDGLLIKEQGKQHVYFTSNGTKRPIASGEAFEKLGFKWNNVIELDEKSLSNIPDGAYIDYKE